MNLYIRYFDHEALAHNMDEVVNFLRSIGEFKVDDSVANRILNFVGSDNNYPFRLKVSYSNYVLFLKTEAADMAEFKRMEQARREEREEMHMTMAERKKAWLEELNQPREGWYESTIMFKRVIFNPESGKCQYVDTTFRARLKAKSAMDCYNRMIEHLENRQDIDHRSQFPSVKSNNFEYIFLDQQ